jgi:hypothetical protein
MKGKNKIVQINCRTIWEIDLRNREITVCAAGPDRHISIFSSSSYKFTYRLLAKCVGKGLIKELFFVEPKEGILLIFIKLAGCLTDGSKIASFIIQR